MNIIEINNLEVEIDSFTLKIEHLEIPKGNIFEIKGKNGSGKTILLNTFLDMMNYSGTMKIHTPSIYGFINNDFLIPYLTPLEYFKFLGKINNIPNYFERCENLVKTFQLDLGKKKYIRHLSEGNKKKVGIISILATNADIMIFDEPFAYLDAESCITFVEQVNRKLSEQTIIFTSHENNYNLVPHNIYQL